MLALERIVRTGLDRFRHRPGCIRERNEHADFGLLAVYMVRRGPNHRHVYVVATFDWHDGPFRWFFRPA